MSEAAGTEIIAQHAESTGTQTQRHKHLSVQQKYGKGGEVAGKVDDLGKTIGLTHRDMGKACQKKQKECASARAVKAVVDADTERNDARAHECLRKGERDTIRFGKEILFAQNIQRGERHNDEHNQPKKRIAQRKSSPRTQCGTERRN